MANITNEINDFREAVYGEEVRRSLISLATKVNTESGTAYSLASGYSDRIATAEGNASSANTNATNANATATNAYLKTNEFSAKLDLISSKSETIVDSMAWTRTKNIFDCYDNFEDGFYMPETGVLTWASYWHTTSTPVPVEAGVKYRVYENTNNTDALKVVGFKADGTYLGYCTGNTWQKEVDTQCQFFTPTSDVAYVKFTWSEQFDHKFYNLMVCKADDFTNDPTFERSRKYKTDFTEDIQEIKASLLDIDDEVSERFVVYDKNDIDSFIASYLASNSIEGKSDDTIWIDDIPEIKIEGDTLSQLTNSKNAVDARYTLKFKNILLRTGYCNIKYQGNSSLSYPKKNYTIKFYDDKSKDIDCEYSFNGWGKQQKFVLKANYIDHSHARNIVSARLWSDICRTRQDDLTDEYINSPRFGSVDGFHVKLYKNGTYEGLYTFNIPKDGWTFGMKKTDGSQSVLCGENYQSGCFNASPVIDGTDWSLEYPSTLSTTIKTAWTNAVNWVMGATSTTFKTGLHNYFDVNSLIDYYIFAYVSCGIDSMGKNQLYITYNNGAKWYASMYDMDSTWGLYWNGTKFISATTRMQADYESCVTSMSHPADGNQLYKKLELYMATEIKERYSELRETVLSENYICERFEAFMNTVPEDLYTQDGTIYSGIPQKSVDHLSQIKTFVHDRLEYVDSAISALT